MKILPKNQAKEKDITPKVFFIWGQSMSGKTYLARQFPDPIILNTDGNAKKVTTPSVEVFDFETFMGAIKELEAGTHDFRTIIIDLVDDIKTMLEMYVLKKYDADNLADIPWGKGYNEVKGTWQRLMVRLSQMPYNVIFISHIQTATDDRDNEKVVEVPSLEQKFYNMTMGRSDMSIKCRKLGNNYSQLVISKRDHYTPEDFKDKEVLEVIKDAIGLFPVSGKITPKPKTGGSKTLKQAKSFAGRVDDVLDDIHETNKKNDEQGVEEKPKKVIKPIKKVDPIPEEVIPATIDDLEGMEQEAEEEVVEPTEEKPKKVAKKKAVAKKEKVEDTNDGVVTGYYFDPNTAEYSVLRGDEKPTEDMIPVPKAIYDTAVKTGTTETEEEVIDAEIVEETVEETVEKPKVVKKAKPKVLKPMAGTIV